MTGLPLLESRQEWAELSCGRSLRASNVSLSVFQMNTVLFIFLLRRINGVTKFKENMTRAKHVRAWLRRSAMLLPVLGVTWSFGLLTFVSSTVVFHYVFTILNSLQGFFIFVNFCILDDTVSYLSDISCCCLKSKFKELQNLYEKLEYELV